MPDVDELAGPPPCKIYWRVSDPKTGQSCVSFAQTAFEAYRARDLVLLGKRCFHELAFEQLGTQPPEPAQKPRQQQKRRRVTRKKRTT